MTTYTYAADNAVLSTVYTNAAVTTPAISYTYDASYSRVLTMTDGNGLTTYTYRPAGQLGAGQLASLDGPLTNDTLTYTYDELGRVTARGIDGVGVTWAFDALGRVTTEVSALGTFSYTYDGVSGRIKTVSYPNAQTSTYDYFDNAGDRRLETINHKNVAGVTRTRFDYTYDQTGNILSWRQQADAATVVWAYGYDNVDQLTWAVKKTADAVPVVLETQMYSYDDAGNRPVEA